MSNLNDVETVLAVVRRAIWIDKIETQQRIDFEADGVDDWHDWQTINTRHWERHEQRCASLKLEEQRLLDVLTQHYIHSARNCRYGWRISLHSRVKKVNHRT